MFDLSSYFGFVLQFDDVILQSPEYTEHDDVLRVIYSGKTRAFCGDGPVVPILVSGGQFLGIEILSRNVPAWTEQPQEMSTLVTRFTMHATPYPIHTLPPEIETGVYNCSPPYIVPGELQCDGITQCQAGQDELDYNCSYTHLGCDDGWVAEGVFCFLFNFTTSLISPDEAKAVCRDEHQADLASLPNPGARQLATGAIARRGHDELIVGLEKVQTAIPGLEHLYRFLWQWPKVGTEFKGPQPTSSKLRCATLSARNELRAVSCSEQRMSGHVCSRLNSKHATSPGPENVNLKHPSRTDFRLAMKSCFNYFVHPFHSCFQFGGTDVSAAYLPHFSCENGRRLHYTMMCDGYDDCGDNTDENNCQNVRSDALLASSFTCTRQTQLVDTSYRCNGILDCHDGSDEENCEDCIQDTVLCEGLGCMPCSATFCSPNGTSSNTIVQPTSLLEMVTVDRFGIMTLKDTDTCPESYFLCGQKDTNTYCIPTFLVGNGQYDCPSVGGIAARDEPRGRLECPGHYRCYKYHICIHPTYVCDGVYQCPLKDDERYCHLTCPHSCTCEGFAFTCTGMFKAAIYLHVRYLDLSGSFKPTLETLHYLGYLQFLSLSSYSLEEVFLGDMVHLNVLDLSHNNMMKANLSGDNLPALEVLKISSSNLTSVTLTQMSSLQELDLSQNDLMRLTIGNDSFPSLRRLDLSTCKLNSVTFVGMVHLIELDLSENNLGTITLKSDSLEALELLNVSSSMLNDIRILHLFNLRVLDLSYNNLTALSVMDLKGLYNVTHLNLSDNPFLTRLDAEFATFLRFSGISSVESLFLSNTGIQHIEVDPFPSLEAYFHLDCTKNPVRNVSQEIFTSWKELDIFETTDINICCAYYSVFLDGNTVCRTDIETVQPSQCNISKLTMHQGREKTGCDERWLPHESFCFRFVLPNKKISADVAARDCRDTFDAALAALPTPAAKELAARVLGILGHKELVVGLEKVHSSVVSSQSLYRFVWRWTQAGISLDGPGIQGADSNLNCGLFAISNEGETSIKAIDCSNKALYAFVCSRANPEEVASSRHPFVTLPAPSRLFQPLFPTEVCDDDTLKHPFYPCLIHAENTGSAAGSSVYLFCSNGQYVHYTVTCDGFDDCDDGSDEKHCHEVRSELLKTTSFRCTGRTELIDVARRCDGRLDCHDGTDEEKCQDCSDGVYKCGGFGCVPKELCDKLLLPGHRRQTSRSHPEKRYQQADLDGYGVLSLTAVQNCPETHFQCIGGYCIPGFLLNNGQPDCPRGFMEDEPSEGVLCPGHYRCYKHQVCLHPAYLCDGVYHCPLKDDERYCNLSCPENCTCKGLAYVCTEMFDSADYLHVRYLDLSGSFQPPLEKLRYVGFLHFLNLSSCGLGRLSLKDLVHLRVLDLSFNNLTSMADLMLGIMPSLSHLDISNNPLFGRLESNFSHFLAATGMEVLQNLELSSTGITSIEENMFVGLVSLTHVDIQDNEIKEISRYMFHGLTQLKSLETDDPRLCCPYFYLYPNNTMDCRTSISELSSCNDLLRTDYFRVFLWTLSAMAITGNIGVLIYRMVIEAQGSSSGFRVFVANLCVADFLMGVYMMIIGAADAHYSGQYIWQEEQWTSSGLCHAAGFLALLSSEMSALIVCLITLDRLIVLRFPLHRHLHLTARSAMMACGATWLAGIILASVPLIPAKWTFYGQTGICLPLPITRKPFPGQQYAFGVFVIFNFFLFVLIGVGQLLIYHAIRSTPMASKTQRHKQDMSIARRLFTVILSDFFCWFPIGLMGLLASRGFPIPGEINVWAAILILPVNSGMNPFLYSLSIITERWLKKKEKKRIQSMLKKLQAEMVTWSKERVQELHRHCQRALLRLKASGRSKTRPKREATAKQRTEAVSADDVEGGHHNVDCLP